MEPVSTLYCWRHPKPKQVFGRCIGQTNCVIDPRQARRLAYRIQVFRRRYALPKIIYTSDLQRCSAVGYVLKKLGWQHIVMPQFREMNFGSWEGRTWESIGQPAVDAWVADFAHYRVGGAESTQLFLQRIQLALAMLPRTALLVAHAGVMRSASRLLGTNHFHERLHSQNWPVAPAYGELMIIEHHSKKDRNAD